MRSKQWAVIRDAAPVMDWDVPGLMTPVLADAHRRMAAVRGSAAVMFFAHESAELFARLEYNDEGVSDLHDDDKKPIILSYYAELEELHGVEHAQRFVRFWVTMADYLAAVKKGAIARAGMRRQVNRVARR